MNSQLLKINSRIERKLQEYRHEAEASQLLLSRANRLTQRLAVLREKLRMCFDLDASSHSVPPNLKSVLQQMSAADPDDAPADFICPITQCVMIDPVRTSDGHCYDRAAILEWFMGFQAKHQCPTSPLTNLPLGDCALIADAPLRSRIQSFLREQSPALDGVQPAVAALALPERSSLNAREVPLQGGGRAPIWSSSVVPPQEANSRALNMLRVSDVEVPESELQVRGSGASGGSSTTLQQQLLLRRAMRAAAEMTGEDEDESSERRLLSARSHQVPTRPPPLQVSVGLRFQRPDIPLDESRDGAAPPALPAARGSSNLNARRLYTWRRQ